MVMRNRLSEEEDEQRVYCDQRRPSKLESPWDGQESPFQVRELTGQKRKRRPCRPTFSGGEKDPKVRGGNCETCRHRHDSLALGKGNDKSCTICLSFRAKRVKSLPPQWFRNKKNPLISLLKSFFWWFFVPMPAGCHLDAGDYHVGLPLLPKAPFPHGESE